MNPKITLITGPANVGKTTFASKWIQSYASVGGVLCEKKFEAGVFKGYSLFSIQTQLKRPFLEWDGEANSVQHQKQSRSSQLSIGPFRVLESGLSFGKAQILAAVVARQTVVIDEIGMAELNGQLFFDVLETVVGSGLDFILVVQKKALAGLLARFPQLISAEIIEVNSNE